MPIKTNALENLAGDKRLDVGKIVDGSAKAWANLNGTGAIALRDSYNISSVIDVNTGDYTLNYTNSMVNTDYTASGNNGFSTTKNFNVLQVILGAGAGLATTYVRLGAGSTSANVAVDAPIITCAIHGGVA